MRSALFLDLGGTLLKIENDEVFVSSGGEIELLTGVAERLKRLQHDLVFVVTNQASIDDGALELETARGWITQLEQRCDIRFDDVWICPRRESDFRKPSPLMVLALADKHFVDLSRSLYVGDSQADFLTAQAAGVEFCSASDFF